MTDAPDEVLSHATIAALEAFYRAGGSEAVVGNDMPAIIDAFRAVAAALAPSTQLDRVPVADCQAQRLLTAVEAGKVLGIHAVTVRELWNSGQMEHVKLGRGRKVSIGQLDRYIGSLERHPSS